MVAQSVISAPSIDWGVAGRPMPGENVCGDMHLVKPIRDGVLAAVVDGLGHGQEAFKAASTAIEVIEENAEEPLTVVVVRCHEALRRTRGAVMTVATLDSSHGQLNWLGVGGVQVVLLRSGRRTEFLTDRALLLRAGVVGYRLPPLRVGTLALTPDDLLLFATNGVGVGLADEVRRGDSPRRLATRIIERQFKGRDDALVLVVRYLGTEQEWSSATARQRARFDNRLAS